MSDLGSEPTSTGPTRRICFVCTGNICRSPMAEVVARSLAAAAGPGDALVFDSAGTGDWHVGQGMDRRAAAALRRRGYDPSGHRARQWDPAWIGSVDLVVAGREHAAALGLHLDGDPPSAVLLSAFGPPGSPRDIPDPYSGTPADFEACLDLIEACCRGLVAQVATGWPPGRRR